MPDQDWKSTLISKAPDIFHILLTVLGIAIIVLGIVGGVAFNGWFPVTDLYPRLFLGLLGVLTVGLGLYLRKTTAIAEVPNPKDYIVEIMHAQPGDKVQNVDIYGTIKNAVPPDYKLWIFRVYSDGSIWPLRECGITGDRWYARDCDLGGKMGEKRDFSVNLVGPDGAALIKYLHAAMERHIQFRDEIKRATGKDSNLYSPLIKEQTRDMVECSRVRVERG